MNFITRAYLFIFLFSVGVLLSAQTSERIFFDSYSQEKGLSHVAVTSIMQDSKGFLWIGTANGLNRYDGDKFRVFKNNPDDSASIPYIRIFSIIESHDSLIWIGTEEGLRFFDPSYEKFYKPDISDFNLDGSKINRLFEDSQQRIWVLGSQNNIYVIERDRVSIRNIFIQNGQVNSTSFFDIAEDSQGYFFIASSAGLITIDSELSIIQNGLDLGRLYRAVEIQNDSLLWIGSDIGLISAYYHNPGEEFIEIEIIREFLANEAVIDLIIDRNSNIWVGMVFDGLRMISHMDNSKFSIYSYKNNPDGLNSLSNDRISCLFEDRQGLIWIGNSEKGLDKYDPSNRGFITRSRVNSGQFGLESDYIFSLVEYEDEVFVGTRANGIFVMETEHWEFIDSKYDFDVLREKSVHSFLVDSRDILWIGTSVGLYRLLPGEKELENVSFDIFSDRVYKITEDDWGNIWLGTGIGLKKLSMNTDFSVSGVNDHMFDFEHSDNRIKIREVYNDPFDSTMWIGTWHNGLLRMVASSNEMDEIEYRQYSKDPNARPSLNSNFVTSVLRESETDLWIGTEGGGFYHGDISGMELVLNNESSGISNYVVKGILPDNLNNLWISTNNGLNKFLKAEKQFKVFKKEHGISSNYFSTAALKTSGGYIILGGNAGLSIFNPSKIISDTIPPIPEFGSFLISNQIVNPLEVIDGKIILSKSITEIKQIDLTYKQNTIAFELLGLQYTDPQNNRFKYRLIGFDEDWNYSRKYETYANYTKLKPGDYTFEFYVANSYGLWSENPKTIQLSVNPPFWQTWYAIIFYILVTICVLTFFYRLNKRIVTLKHNVEIEKIETRKNHELTEAKVKFFMNISHEIKTPISLILGPLQKLSEHFSIDSNAGNYFSIINEQANYLINLLEQLVYFRKAESDTLELKCRYLDLVSFTERILASFQWMANEQRIDLKFIYSSNELYLWFDPKKMEKVFYNLISNAVKYTNPGGQIKLILDYDDRENALFKIIDSGIGISEEHIDKIFDRFYQVDDSKGGYGIGLSLSKSLVELHRGNISVKSTLEKGTEFRILLKTGTSHLIEKQMIMDSQHSETAPDDLKANDEFNVIGHTNDASMTENEKEVILIVEDNLRMLSFLQGILNPEYRIMTAVNGKEALDLTSINLPDLIISDITMSEMDGITLLNEMKGDIMTCHIPFILLTAKGEKENKIEGLEKGADAYIPKPFDIDLLMAKVKSLLHNMNMIKKRIKMNLPFDLSSEKLNPLDKDLLDKIMEVVSENYSNPDFDSNIFSRKVYMNRSKLFKKLKALTNQTPSEFIRLFRMNKAVEYLIKDKIQISEVHYKIGISSRSYFTKCFKEIYGVTPSEFMKNKESPN